MRLHVRPVQIEGSAQTCDSMHIFILWSGDQSIPKTTPHLDIELSCWNKTQRPATLLSIHSATLNGQPLRSEDALRSFDPITLEASGKPESAQFTLHAPEGDLIAQPGDVLVIRFRLNWGTRLVRPKVKLHVGDVKRPRRRIRVSAPRGSVVDRQLPP